MQIDIARLLHTPVVISAAQRPDVVIHRSRPGFIERQDGSWICLPIGVQVRRKNKPKARRRLWNWLASVLGDNSQRKGERL